MINRKTRFSHGRKLPCNRCRTPVPSWAGRWRLEGRRRGSLETYKLWWCDRCHDQQVELQRRTKDTP